GVMVGVAGLALMVTLAVLLAEQPDALVTTRVRLTVPEAPAVYVMVWMLVAEVIVPLTIDHAYVVAAAGPAAEVPVELPQSCCAGGVVVGVGWVVMIALVIVLAGDAEAVVTTSVRSTVPEAPAVYVMVWMLLADVIVPLTIDQAYDVAAGPEAVLAVELAHTC